MATDTMPTETKKPATSGATTKNPIALGDKGLQLRSLDDMWRFCEIVRSAGLSPKGMEKNEQIFVALQMGAELGLSPMASLQNIAVINGRPSIWGDAMLAVCRASGQFDEACFEELQSDTEASCTCRRLPNGQPCTRTFSMQDAKLAGLALKAGPWTQYPRRMLQMRARSWALRDTFSDTLRGLSAAEEVGDYIDVTATASDPTKVGRSLLNDRRKTVATSQVEHQPETTEPEQQQEEPNEIAAGLAQNILAVSLNELAKATDAAVLGKLLDRYQGETSPFTTEDQADIFRKAANIAKERILGKRGAASNQKQFGE